MRTPIVAIALTAIAIAGPAARAATCSGSAGLAKTNGTYAPSQGPCTLNADNYYNEYLATSTPTPSTQTVFPSTVADFAGTDASGHLKKLTADRVGACPNAGGTCAASFIKGDDPSGQPANETSSHAHVAFFNPDTSNGKLLVFLPGHGVNPRQYTHFMIRAARQGYHAVALSYLNVVSADNCHEWQSNEIKGWGLTPSVDDCITNMQRFKSEGTALSSWYQSDFTSALRSELGDPAATAGAHDSIANRLGLLLYWLDTQFPNQHWNDYFSFQCSFFCQTTINWSRVAVAAHSMGSNVGFYVARVHTVDRLIMTSGPEEYLAVNDAFGASYVPSYVSSTAATPLDRIYVFCSTDDTKVCTRAQNAYLNGFGYSPFWNPTFDVDAGNPFVDGEQLLLTGEDPDAGCSAHSWLITNCDPARPFWYRDTWDWMLSN